MVELAGHTPRAFPDRGEPLVVVVGEDLYQNRIGELEQDLRWRTSGGELLLDEGEVRLADAAAEAGRRAGAARQVVAAAAGTESAGDQALGALVRRGLVLSARERRSGENARDEQAGRGDPAAHDRGGRGRKALVRRA